MSLHILAGAAFAALLAPLPAAAQDWYRLERGDAGVQYIDLSSIRPEDGYLSASAFMVLDAPMRGYTYFATTMQYDCKARAVRLMRMVAYQSKDSSTGDIANAAEQEFGPVNPGSPGDAAMNYVCNLDRSHAVKVQDPWTDKP
jgi:hypothetical protein